MDSKQNTLDGFVKIQKRPTNEGGLYKKPQLNSTIGIVKQSRKLSFDSTSQQTIKKQKVECDKTQTIFYDNLNVTNATNTNTDNIVETVETEHKNEVEPERARTPDQSPSTKAKLRKELDLGEFRKIVRCKHNFKKLQEKINAVEQCQNDLQSAESKVEAAKNHYLSFKSIDFMVNTSPMKPELNPIKQSILKPTVLFPNSTQSMISSRLMMEKQTTLPQVNVSPGKLLDEIESFLDMSPSDRYSALASSKRLPLPVKYRNLYELYKTIETTLSMLFKKKAKITFNKLKRVVQHMTRKNFTEIHLAQIKTIVPDFFEFSLIKSSRDKSSFELEIAPVYGLENEDNVDLIELTTRRKKIVYNLLLDRMKKHHKEFLSKLTPPILIDDNSITVIWHCKFDVETAPDIIPSALPKIEIDKPRIATVKDISDRTRALSVYNNLLNRTFTTKNGDNENEEKFSTEDSKIALKEALNSIPMSFLPKDEQEEKNNEVITRLDEDKMIIRLPDIARKIHSYFKKHKRNVMSLNKIIDKLKRSYPEAIADYDWQAHFNCLEEKVPHWIETKVRNGIQHIQINKKVEFKENVIDKLKN